MKQAGSVDIPELSPLPGLGTLGAGYPGLRPGLHWAVPHCGTHSSQLIFSSLIPQPQSLTTGCQQSQLVS